MANALREQSEIDEHESYNDTTFASGKGDGEEIGRTGVAKA